MFACSSVLLFLAMSPAGEGQTPPSLVLGQQHKIVVLGEGVTQEGFRTGGFVWWMKTALAVAYPDLVVEFIDACRRGDHVTDMARRFERDVLAQKPNWIVICTGLNDVWDGFDKGNPEGNGPKGTTLADFKDKLQEMVRAALKAGVQVAICTTTLLTEHLDGVENELLDKYNDVLVKTALYRKCLLVDVNKAFRDVLSAPALQPDKTGGTWLTRDGMRLNARGSETVAEVALRAFGMPEADINRVRQEVKKKAGG